MGRVTCRHQRRCGAPHRDFAHTGQRGGRCAWGHRRHRARPTL